MKERPDGFVSFQQLINLPKGHQYLSIIVFDPASGRKGTLHLAVDVG